MPPTIPCAMIPPSTPKASRCRRPRSGKRVSTTQIEARARMPTTPVSVRFPNSMRSWYWLASVRTGVTEPGTHSGQVGQPRPLPVSRTTPPVTTMPISPTRLAMRIGRAHAAGARGIQPGRREATDTPSGYAAERAHVTAPRPARALAGASQSLSAGSARRGGCRTFGSPGDETWRRSGLGPARLVARATKAAPVRAWARTFGSPGDETGAGPGLAPARLVARATKPAPIGFGARTFGSPGDESGAGSGLGAARLVARARESAEAGPDHLRPGVARERDADEGGDGREGDDDPEQDLERTAPGERRRPGSAGTSRRRG